MSRLRRFKDGHLRERPQYNHWTPDNENVPFTTTLAFMQPIPAVIGLIFCILTVFVFATARWWNGDARTVDALAAFIGVSPHLTPFYIKGADFALAARFSLYFVARPQG